jgi:predicted transcriptional regulator
VPQFLVGNMGVSEDIDWLKDDESLGKIFQLISEKGIINLRTIKEFCDSEDWWPVKSYARALVDRGLVTKNENGYTLTEEGRKVRESLKAMEYFPKI